MGGAMIRFVAGGVAALLLAAAGFLAWSGSGRSEDVALPRPFAAAAMPTQDETVDAPPAATEASREERRFARYDRDRDGAVGREEYLAARRKAFARLDLDHDGKLSFDEYAAKTVTRFTQADADKSGTLAPAEFAKTRVARRYRPRCPPRQAADAGDDA